MIEIVYITVKWEGKNSINKTLYYILNINTLQNNKLRIFII